MDGKIEFYNKIYKANPDKWNLGWRDKILYYILSHHLVDPDSILDIGCGNGHSIEYLKRVWPLTNYYGIDLSDEAIRLAKERVPEANFICGDYEEVEIPQCEVVLLMGVAEHFENLIPSLRNLKKYGELIYLEVPDCLRGAINKGSKNRKEGFRKTVKGSDQKEWHLKRRTWEEKIGFADLEIIRFYPGQSNFVWVLR